MTTKYTRYQFQQMSKKDVKNFAKNLGIKVNGYSKDNLIDMILVRQIDPNYPVNEIEFREIKIHFRYS